MSDNWIINNLLNTFETWNDNVAEVWFLISQTPQSFKGGGIWNVIVTINGSLKAMGYALLVLFLVMSIFGGTMNFRDFKNWQTAFRYFIRFAAAKTAVTYALDIMLAIFNILQGAFVSISNTMTGLASAEIELPDTIQEAINNTGFLASIPLWFVTLLGCLVVVVLGIFMVMTVYGRFFRIYLYTAISPLPLSTFAGEGTSSIGKAFIKSYAGVCLEGVVIFVCLVIFSAYADSSTLGAIDSALPAVNQVWNYLFEVIFNMLVLIGLVKGSDRIVKEIFGT